MQHTEATRHRQIRIRQKSVADPQALGKQLAAFVRIRADREDLGPGRFELVRDGSKTLELGGAERSPVAAIEDEDDGFLPAVLGQARRATGGVR
jgi:hypothetical protein